MAEIGDVSSVTTAVEMQLRAKMLRDGGKKSLYHIVFVNLYLYAT